MKPQTILRELIRSIGPSTAKALVSTVYGDLARFIALGRLAPEQVEDLRRIALRIREGEPLQYIVGHCEFMSLPFRVTPDVLIPRPETETLVEIVLERGDSGDVYYDLGTGSGAIAVALSYHGGMRGYAVDVSKPALEIAKENAQINGVFEKIEFIWGDTLKPLQDRAMREDVTVIVSNPPYIPTDMLDSLPKQVRREPKMALDGGPDGLTFYRRIFREFRELISGKRIYLEFAPYEREGLVKILQDAGVRGYTFFEGLDGLVRYVEVFV